jgi:hypothetical protein
VDHQNPNSQVNAVTGVGVNSLAVAVNLRGAFGSSNALGTNEGKIKANTDRARVFILLHEFGHLLSLPDFLSDRGNPDAGKTNNKAVEENCGKTITRFDGSKQWDWRKEL